MTHATPSREPYSYDYQRNPDGSARILNFDDGRPYINIYAMAKVGTKSNPVRIVARTGNIRDAEALVAALNLYTRSAYHRD